MSRRHEDATATIAYNVPWESASFLTEMVTPTNGTLMAVTAAAGIKYGDWLTFAVPVYLGLLGVGAIAIVVAIVTGL